MFLNILCMKNVHNAYLPKLEQGRTNKGVKICRRLPQPERCMINPVTNALLSLDLRPELEGIRGCSVDVEIVKGEARHVRRAQVNLPAIRLQYYIAQVFSNRPSAGVSIASSRSVFF